MGVIQDTDTVVYLFLHQISHTLSKRAGIADGGSLTDTGGKGEWCPPPDSPENGPAALPFPRAAAAVDKAHQLDVILTVKSTLFVPGWYENPGFRGSSPLSAYNG